MSGSDEFDSTVSSKDPSNKKIKIPNKKFNFGIPDEYLKFEGLDIEIKNKLMSIIEKLKEDGHKVEILKFPFFKISRANLLCSNYRRSKL